MFDIEKTDVESHNIPNCISDVPVNLAGENQSDIAVLDVFLRTRSLNSKETGCKNIITIDDNSNPSEK